MNHRMPALALVAVPGRRSRTIDLAKSIDAGGFSGIYCPSFGDAMSLCLSIAHVTEHVQIGTAIHPIYLQHPDALAATASYIQEVAEGRFRLGLGVTHGPVHQRLGLNVGKPLADTRDYVEAIRAAANYVGEVPPIVLATLRDKMVGLSVEVSDGAVWANASRSRMAHSLSLIPQDRIDAGFFVGNMIPTVIDDDRAAGAARNRATLRGYVALPNYRNYWKDAGYTEEMEAVEAGIAAKDEDAIAKAMTEAWLADCTLFGSASEVRDGVEAWYDAGVTTPILVPSSTSGGQMKAFAEIFDLYGLTLA